MQGLVIMELHDIEVRRTPATWQLLALALYLSAAQP